jgi:hypothetical protein
MITKRSARNFKSQSEADLNEGRVEVVEQLMEIPVSQLHQCDPTLFARITPDQRADIFSHIAQQSEPSGHRPPTNIVRYKHRKTFLIGRLWRALPLAVRSQSLGLLLSSALAISFLGVLAFEGQFASFPASLPSDTSSWPKCNRLTPSMDGCVYVVSDSLTWRDAATLLGFDPRDDNRHLANRKTLQRGDKLIVWRKLIPLEN